MEPSSAEENKAAIKIKKFFKKGKSCGGGGTHFIPPLASGDPSFYAQASSPGVGWMSSMLFLSLRQQSFQNEGFLMPSLSASLALVFEICLCSSKGLKDEVG